MYSSWLSQTKSRDYNARLPSRERNRRCCTSFLLLILLFLLLSRFFRIPPPPVVPPFSALPSFYFESHDPLSPQTFAQHASPPFLFTASKLLFFAYLLSYPSLGPDFVHTMWSATYSFSFTERYLSSRRKKRDEGKE